jgi:hypothetical protein
VDKFDWQRAITSDQGPASPTTRHVLLTLSIFMDQDGDNCFPSTRKISSATGLSERSVCTHLDLAASAGWIEKIERTKSGQGWKRHSYKASLPKNVLKEVQHVEDGGTETGSARYPIGTEPHSEGTEPDDNKALKEVQSTSTFTRSCTINNERSFLLKDNSIFQIDDKFYHMLKTTYPFVDVDHEIKKIIAWCFSNESKRKTRNGAKRFVNSWMANAKPAENQQLDEEFDFANQFRHA